MPFTDMAHVEQDAPTKVLILHIGDITPSVMREYKDACNAYFGHKEITANKQVKKITAGLKDSRIKDWISADCKNLQSLSFTSFMSNFHDFFLEANWEESTHCELLGMNQGGGSFWAYAVRVQAHNSLLNNTSSYLVEEKLHHQMEAGMEAHSSVT